MKFSYKWLNEYLTTDIELKNLTKKLTAAGLEVESVDPVAEDFSGIVVGKIESISKHPEADRLNICQVNIGEDDNLTIVCGANNIYVGMIVPVATIGAKLPTGDKIKKGKLRGQESFGMLCSEKELSFDGDVDGIMDLPSDAGLGLDLREYLDLDDYSIEVDLTPNRSDCLSVFGIAREVSALTFSKVKQLDIPKNTSSTKTTRNVNIMASRACNKYVGLVIENINPNIKTPLWMREKLRRSGIKSTSLVVDVTNFVMIFLGQPMHAYDNDKLSSDISVGYANKNTELLLLNNNLVKLDSETLVISDSSKVLAIAGVMGGLEGAITDTTKNIFLESANFDSKNISGKARKYGLHTDSSKRFERGVDSSITEIAINYAAHLIVSLAGGNIGEPIIKEHNLKEIFPIEISLNKVTRVLGLALEMHEIKNILVHLGMNVNQKDDSILIVTPPSYRFDINIAEDLVEEIARVYGYDKIPEIMPEFKANKVQNIDNKTSADTFKIMLSNMGYSEAINYSFIDKGVHKYFFNNQGIELQNPISAELSVMRQSLLPSLIKSYKENISRQQLRVRLFEVGVCFIEANKKRIESEKIAGLVSGSLFPLNWSNKKQVDFYDVKADVVALCKTNNLDIDFEICKDIHWLHPGQSAYVLHNKNKIGVIGVLHPNTIKFMNIKAEAPIVFELNLPYLQETSLNEYQSISKFPAVKRDIAVIVDINLESQEIVKTIKSLGIENLQSIKLFDIYEGKNLPDNKKSLAFNLVFQDKNHTLVDDELEKYIENILLSLEKIHGAKLRY